MCAKRTATFTRSQASIFECRFGLASLLSTVFSDAWRPLLITMVVAVAVGFARFGFFDVMSAADYFRGESLPWLGLAACAALTTGLLHAAVLNVERRDF